MQSLKLKLKRLRLFAFLFLLLSTNVFSQNNIKGDWLPQNYVNSCWAASLDNLTKAKWPNGNSPSLKRNWQASLIGAKNLKYFSDLASIDFKFRALNADTVLTMFGINHYLSYKYPRPLILSYNFENTDNLGHFINLIGADTTNSKNPIYKNWLKIFDPKPDSIGTFYFKNYESYRLVNSLNSKKNLKGTFFNFVMIDSLPIIKKPQDRQLATALNRYNCNNCIDLNKKNTIKNTLEILLTETIFDTLHFGKLKFPTNFLIPMIEIYESEEDLQKQLSTSSNFDDSYLAIGLDFISSNIKAGAVLKPIKYKKYLIERIESLEKYKDLKIDFENLKEPTILILKDEFRILRFKKKNDNSFFFKDMDNLLGKNKPNIEQIYSLEDLAIKLKPHYIKVSDGTLNIIESINNMLTNSSESCKADTNMNAILTDIPISELRDKDSLEMVHIKNRFPIRISYVKNSTDSIKNDEFYLVWNCDWLKNDSIPICPQTYPKLKNYQDQDEFFNGNRYGSAYMFFVPIEKFHEYQDKNSSKKEVDIYELKDQLAIKASKIKQIVMPRIEIQKAHLGKNFEKNFSNEFSAVGIICDLILEDNQLIQCYLFNNIIKESLPNASQYAWKK